jgi:hypothetical protein
MEILPPVDLVTGAAIEPEKALRMRGGRGGREGEEGGGELGTAVIPANPIINSPISHIPGSTLLA